MPSYKSGTAQTLFTGQSPSAENVLNEPLYSEYFILPSTMIVSTGYALVVALRVEGTCFNDE